LSKHPSILYLLLWVSERGYAIQHALPISLQNTISLSSIETEDSDSCIRGLVNLAELFIAFDSSSVPQFSRYGKFPVSARRLVTVEEGLADVLPLPSQPHTQRADFLVTKQWMRILLWQQALSRGLLSSISPKPSLAFFFPARIAQDLLQCMVAFSADQILPLGRDQLVKLFEITNTLADVILCNPQLDNREHRRLGASDFLHGLYQSISPFMEVDVAFNSMLREKTAEVLLRAPTRLWTFDSDQGVEEDDSFGPSASEDNEHDYSFDTRFHGELDDDHDMMYPFDIDPDLFVESLDPSTLTG